MAVLWKRGIWKKKVRGTLYMEEQRQVLSEYYVEILCQALHPRKACVAVIPILQMKKVRHREVVQLAHPA